MLLEKLDILNAMGSTLTLPLEKDTKGFFVRDVKGLGPVKATLTSSTVASLDGAWFSSGRREPRNLLIKLGLDPDYSLYSAHDLRNELYDYLMPNTEAKVKLRMYDHRKTGYLDQYLNVEIDVRVESLELDMFTRDPSVDISLIAYRPEFVDPENTIFEGVTTDTLDEELLDYQGTINTGVLFTIFPNRALREFTIYHIPPNQKLYKVYYTQELEDSTTLEISSIPGNKYVRRYTNGIESNRLPFLAPQSDWLTLMPADNKIRVYAEGAPVPYTIEYQNKYGGL